MEYQSRRIVASTTTQSLSSATTSTCCVLLHETFGGGFSPTAVLKLSLLARKLARGSVDRTDYSPKYSLSFMSHHAERISLSALCEA